MYCNGTEHNQLSNYKVLKLILYSDLSLTNFHPFTMVPIGNGFWGHFYLNMCTLANVLENEPNTPLV